MSVGTNALRRHEAAQRSHDTVLDVSEALNEQWQLDDLRDNIDSLLSNKAEFHAALQMYERCVVEGYMATMSYNDIGVALLENGDLQDAQQMFERSIAIQVRCLKELNARLEQTCSYISRACNREQPQRDSRSQGRSKR